MGIDVMVYHGHVQKGVVVLDDAGELRDGTAVTVRPVTAKNQKKTDNFQRSKRSAVGRGLSQLAGKAKNLPADASKNLDHYLYGHPKQ
jgi:hypothetical protein